MPQTLAMPEEFDAMLIARVLKRWQHDDVLAHLSLQDGIRELCGRYGAFTRKVSQATSSEAIEKIFLDHPTEFAINTKALRFIALAKRGIVELSDTRVASIIETVHPLKYHPTAHSAFLKAMQEVDATIDPVDLEQSLTAYAADLEATMVIVELFGPSEMITGLSASQIALIPELYSLEKPTCLM